MSLLSAAAGASAAQQSRSASAVVARPACGFHVLRVDGYSVTTTLPAGERVTSEPFYVGGRSWLVDFYPNGTDGSVDSDSDAIAVYLRLEEDSHEKERVRADFKFSLLDLSGTAAYELPPETGIFTSAGYGYDGGEHEGGAGRPGCGYATFITKEDLGRRRETLLKEDSLAIRCDVGVAEVDEAMDVAPTQRHGGMRPMPTGRGRGRGYHSGGGYDYESPDEYDDGGRRGQRPPDDKEFIRRCLARK